MDSEGRINFVKPIIKSKDSEAEHTNSNLVEGVHIYLY